MANTVVAKVFLVLLRRYFNSILFDDVNSIPPR